MSVEEDHAQVGLVLLNANPILTGRVFDGKVTLPFDPPYVLVYTKVAFPRDAVGTALDATQKTITTTYTCHCAGETAAAARGMAAEVRSSLLNVRPVLSGRNCSPIKQTDAQEPTRDETTGQLVMDAVVIFDFLSAG